MKVKDEPILLTLDKISEDVSELVYKINKVDNIHNQHSQLVKDCIKEWLPLDTVLEKVTEDNYEFKVIGNLLHISGFLSFGQKIEELETTKKKAPYVFIQNLTNIKGLDQVNFMVYLLYYFVCVFARIGRSDFNQLPISTKSSNVQHLNSGIYKAFLLKEIMLIANAALIKDKYSKLMQNDTAKIEQYVHFLIRAICNELIDAIPGQELCIPAGFDGHSIYLAITKWQGQSFLVRLDNLGEGHRHHFKSGAPHYVLKQNIADLANKESTSYQHFHQYLVSIMSAKFLKKTEALQRIYFDTGLNDIDIVKNIDFPLFSCQTYPGCVIANYTAGLRYRLELQVTRIAGIPRDDLYKWLLTVQLAKVITSDDAPIQNKHSYHAIQTQLDNTKYELMKDPRRLLNEIRETGYASINKYFKTNLPALLTDYGVANFAHETKRFKNRNFSGLNIAYASFRSTNLAYSNFKATVLYKTDLSRANLYKATVNEFQLASAFIATRSPPEIRFFKGDDTDSKMAATYLKAAMLAVKYHVWKNNSDGTESIEDFEFNNFKRFLNTQKYIAKR